MNKYKKSSIVMTIVMIVLMFIPTFNYSAERFDYNYDYFNGLSFDSLGIKDYNESVIILGINGSDYEKYGFYMILTGIVIILISLFLKMIYSVGCC